MKLRFYPETPVALLSIAPVLHFVSYNMDHKVAEDAIRVIAVSLSGAAVLWAFVLFFLRDRQKTAIVVSIFLLFFFTLGHIHDLFRYNAAFYFFKDFARPRYLFLAFVALFLLAFYLTIKTRKNLYKGIVFLNITSFCLVIFPLFPIGVFVFHTTSLHDEFDLLSQREEHHDDSVQSKIPPDIFYIILDSYANESTLRNHLAYDNQEFIDFLKKKGFYVATNSRANYNNTVTSLASTLNMTYLDHLTELAGPETKDRYYGYQMIVKNKVMTFLKSRGYKIIHFNSTHHPTRKLMIADINVNCTHENEFNSIFIQTTMYYFFEKYFKLIQDKRQHIHCTFSKIAEYGKLPGPKFIFAHLVLPHDPYVFGAKGEPVPNDGVKVRETLKRRYLDQLTFANGKVKSLIAQILPQSPPFPIIILQSDHGPAFSIMPHKIRIREVVKNFNAFYLPDQGMKLLYNSISPVNTFRLIFNHYLNTDFNLLEDQSFYSGTQLYNFKKVPLGESPEFHPEEFHPNVR